MAEDKPATRDERLKAALRANLRRRKAQERGRAVTGREPESAEMGQESGGAQTDPQVDHPAARSGPDSDKTGL